MIIARQIQTPEGNASANSYYLAQMMESTDSIKIFVLNGPAFCVIHLDLSDFEVSRLGNKKYTKNSSILNIYVLEKYMNDDD